MRARTRPGRDDLTCVRLDAAHVRLAGPPLRDELLVERWCRWVRWLRCSSPGLEHGTHTDSGSSRLFTCTTPQRALLLGQPCFTPLPSPAPPRPVVGRCPRAPLTPAQRGWAFRRSSSRGRAALGIQAGRGRRGRGQGNAGQGLHAGHNSGQLRWCARRARWEGAPGGDEGA